MRGLGLLMAVELVADQATKAQLPEEAQAADAIRIHGLNHGLMIYSRRTNNGRYGDWFIIAPPLTIEEWECDRLVERLGGALRDLASALRQQEAIR